MGDIASAEKLLFLQMGLLFSLCFFSFVFLVNDPLTL